MYWMSYILTIHFVQPNTEHWNWFTHHYHPSIPTTTSNFKATSRQSMSRKFGIKDSQTKSKSSTPPPPKVNPFTYWGDVWGLTNTIQVIQNHFIILSSISFGNHWPRICSRDDWDAQLPSFKYQKTFNSMTSLIWCGLEVWLADRSGEAPSWNPDAITKFYTAQSWSNSAIVKISKTQNISSPFPPLKSSNDFQSPRNRVSTQPYIQSTSNIMLCLKRTW